MKILLISTCAVPTPPGDRYGGVESVVALLGHGLAMKGNSVAIAGAKGSAENYRRRFSTSADVEFIERPGTFA